MLEKTFIWNAYSIVTNLKSCLENDSRIIARKQQRQTLRLVGCKSSKTDTRTHTYSTRDSRWINMTHQPEQFWLSIVRYQEQPQLSQDFVWDSFIIAIVGKSTGTWPILNQLGPHVAATSASPTAELNGWAATDATRATTTTFNMGAGRRRALTSSQDGTPLQRGGGHITPDVTAHS